MPYQSKSERILLDMKFSICYIARGSGRVEWFLTVLTIIFIPFLSFNHFTEKYYIATFYVTFSSNEEDLQVTWLLKYRLENFQHIFLVQWQLNFSVCLSLNN